MKTLLTFAGLRDPYWHDLFEDGQHRGPILSVLAEKTFGRVVLFSRPSRTQSVEKTAGAIRSLHPRTRVEIGEVDIKDATHYPEILLKLRPALQKLLLAAPKDEYFISPTSGTPEIHACWVLLVASGELPARIYNFKRVAQAGLAQKSIVREVILKETGISLSPEVLARLSPRGGALSRDEILRQSGIIGRHPSLLHALETATIISQYEGPVLIEGEPGTGKGLFATLIHQLGPGAERPCTVVNCSALPPDIAVRVLFGEVTKAGEPLPGKLQTSEGGTLVLKDVHDLPREAQTRLLNFIDEGAIFPVGSTQPLRLRVRVIATTSRRLVDEAAAGRFREDLLQKFSAERLRLPPLRERRSDIALIVQEELKRLNETLPQPRKLTPAALARLEAHDWPDNLTELRDTLAQSVLTSTGPVIDLEDLELHQLIDLPSGSAAAPVRLHPGFSLEDHIAQVRKALIEGALRKTQGNRSRAARLLGVTPQAVSRYVIDHER